MKKMKTFHKGHFDRLGSEDEGEDSSSEKGDHLLSRHRSYTIFENAAKLKQHLEKHNHGLQNQDLTDPRGPNVRKGSPEFWKDHVSPNRPRNAQFNYGEQ